MGTRTILVVDDSEADLFLAQRALERSGIPCDVVVAAGGEQALDYLFARGPQAGRDPSELPAVALLDLKMSRVDGFEVLRRVREHPSTRFLPVVMLTGSDEEADLVQSYAEGCNAYVTKPVDFDRFAEVVRELATFWLQVNVPPPRTRG
jgi:two-component system response regulator